MLALSSKNKKNLTPTFKNIRSEGQAQGGQVAQERNHNGKRGHTAHDQTANRPAKRIRQDGMSCPAHEELPESAQREVDTPSDVLETVVENLQRREVMIPKDQEVLVNADAAWTPPLSGDRPPPCWIPTSLWVQLCETVEEQEELDDTSVNDSIDHTREQVSDSEAGSESSEGESVGQKTHPLRDTQANPLSKPSQSRKMQSPKPNDNLEPGDESDDTDTYSWDPSPSQHTRKQEMPPDSSVEMSPAHRGRKEAEVVGLASTQTSIIVDLEEESDMDVSVPAALVEATHTAEVEEPVVYPTMASIEEKPVLVKGTPPRNTETPESASGSNTSSSRKKMPKFNREVGSILDFVDEIKGKKHTPVLVTEKWVDEVVSEEKELLDDCSPYCSDVEVAPPEYNTTTSPTFEPGREQSVDLGDDSYSGPNISLPRHTPSDADAQSMHEDIDAEKPVDGDAHPHYEDSVIEGGADFDKGVGEVGEVVQDHNDGISIVTQHQSVDEEDSFNSDDVDDMLHNQLQSEMTYSSQVQHSEQIQDASRNTLEQSEYSRDSSPSVQVPASSLHRGQAATLDTASKGKRKYDAISDDEDLDSNASKRLRQDHDEPNDHELQSSHPTHHLDSVARNRRREFMRSKIATRDISSPRSWSRAISTLSSGSSSSSMECPCRDGSVNLEQHLTDFSKSEARPLPNSAVNNKPPQADIAELGALAKEVLEMAQIPAAQPETYLEKIHRRFSEAYDEYYEAEPKHLLGVCKLIQNLTDTSNLAPSPLIYDDFIIRHRHEYRQYLSDCNDEAVHAPMPFADFYASNIDGPEYTKGVITRRVLAGLLAAGNSPSSMSSTPHSGKVQYREPSSVPSSRRSSLAQVQQASRCSSLAHVVSTVISTPKETPASHPPVSAPAPAPAPAARKPSARLRKWYQDANTPYNQFASAYANLKSEKPRRVLMSGNVNVFSWMK
jgi:hypothetical protein